LQTFVKGNFVETLFETNLSLPLIQKGKVRDIYDIDDSRMLIVTTDRLSAFDVVFSKGIAKKGAVLTSVANFWFDKTQHILPNHLTHEPLNSVLNDQEAKQIEGRGIIVKKTKAFSSRSDRSWLYYWLGLEGLPANWQHMRDSPAKQSTISRKTPRSALYTL